MVHVKIFTSKRNIKNRKWKDEILLSIQTQNMYNMYHFTFIFPKQIYFCKSFWIITVFMTFALNLDDFFYFEEYVFLSIEWWRFLVCKKSCLQTFLEALNINESYFLVKNFHHSIFLKFYFSLFDITIVSIFKSYSN